MKRNANALQWITERLEHVAKANGATIKSIDWKKHEQEEVFVVEVHGVRGKKAIKFFDCTEVAALPVTGEEQLLFDSKLISFIRFSKSNSQKCSIL